MTIEFTGRQIVVTQKYKDAARLGLRRIDQLVHGASSAKVVLTVDKYRRIADVTVTHGDQSMVAECQGAEMMKALRDALGKIEQQAVRSKQKHNTTKRHPRHPEAADLAASA